ncbi:hypothetical protein [Candidatus Phytoplasma solani]|uniref:hypothetical protein n=1 Tax=Candidatus Phytoplasma solani TaxID=69896 RepID=UPI00358F6C4E
MREQHVKTLEEIQKQIDNYKNIVKELEIETEILKNQIAKNKKNANKLREELLTKQTQLNVINQELVTLSQQQISLQKELSDLTQTYEEWQKNCEIKSNCPIYTNVNKNGIYFSLVPFQVKIKPILNAEDMRDVRRNESFQNENITTIPSYKTEINGNNVYYIRYSDRGGYIGTLTHDEKSWFMLIDKYKNGPNEQDYWELKFNHDVSATPAK